MGYTTVESANVGTQGERERDTFFDAVMLHKCMDGSLYSRIAERVGTPCSFGKDQSQPPPKASTRL